MFELTFFFPKLGTYLPGSLPGAVLFHDIIRVFLKYKMNKTFFFFDSTEGQNLPWI